MRDRRRIVWIIESCPKNKPALKRIWTADCHVCFDTRKKAKEWIHAWIELPHDVPLDRIFRASMYGPVKR